MTLTHHLIRPCQPTATKWRSDGLANYETQRGVNPLLRFIREPVKTVETHSWRLSESKQARTAWSVSDLPGQRFKFD